jgi:hypothetical protein
MAHLSERYHITFEPHIATVRLEGRVTVQGIIVASEALYGAPEWQPGLSELWDLSAIDSLAVTPEGLREVASFEGDLGAVVGPGRTAIVASTDDAYDIGLLYSYLPKGNGRIHVTFWKLTDARAWLLEGDTVSEGDVPPRQSKRS